MAQMIIANRLIDGVVVFLGTEQTWADSINEGIVIDDEQHSERLLARAKADEANCIVIDPYLIDVTLDGGRPRPASNREAIRAFGPTVRTELLDASKE